MREGNPAENFSVLRRVCLKLYLQVLLKERPDLTLGRSCENYRLVYGAAVSPATMHNLLKRLGHSRKKKHSTTRERRAGGTGRKRTITSRR